MTRMSRSARRAARVVSRLQAFGHRRHAVRLLDRKRDDLRVGRIAADERDVGAVQRGRRCAARAPLPPLGRSGSDRPDTPRSRAARRSARARCRAGAGAPRARSCWSARADAAARETAGYVGVSTRSNERSGMPDRQRNGRSLLMRWTRWPRSARACASSVATTPLPPTDA